MKNFFKRSLSVILCVVLLAATLVTVVPEISTDVSAATYRTAANGPSSSYKGSKYYQHFQRITLTGDGRTDAVALALSQLGYHEGASVYDMDGISSSSGNYTEFNYNMGDWGSNYTYEWCATFCSWALYQSQCTNQNSMSDWARKHIGDANYVWREVGCPSWIQNLKATGMWKYSQYYGGSYKPQPGDLIFFRSGAHIGMVVYSDSSYVYTVEGNTSDAEGVEPAGGGVFFKRYALSSSSVDGYGVLPYKTNSSVQKIDYSGANPTSGLYISNAIKYVYSTATDSTVTAYMPRFTLFEVTEIASNGRLKATYTDTSGATVTGWILNSSDRVIQLTASKRSAKDLLGQSIAAAANTRYDKYTVADLTALRNTYNEAVALYNNSSASESSLTAMKTKLDNAINNTLATKEVLVSVGKSYIVPDGGRTDKYVDDGKRLTDGAKTEADGGTEKFSGFNLAVENTTLDVVVDLGGNVSSNAYRIYTAKCADWGIACPEQIEVSVSNDGKNFTSIGSTTVKNHTNASDKWNMFTMTVNTDTTRTERYIKFTITKGTYVNASSETVSSNHIWLQEVAVMNNPAAASGEVYVTGFNKYITSGDTVIYTPDQGTITAADHNIRYTTNVVADWNGSKYVISSITQGFGADTPSITLKSNQILIAAHNWELGTEDPVIGSDANTRRLKDAFVGDELVLTNINVGNKSLAAAPSIRVVSKHTHDNGSWTTLEDGTKERRCTTCGTLLETVKPSPEPKPDPDPDPVVSIGDVNNDGAINQYDYILVKRHYFETRTLTGDEFARGDVNKDAKVDQYDYILIARHYFGTYTIG